MAKQNDDIIVAYVQNTTFSGISLTLGTSSNNSALPIFSCVAVSDLTPGKTIKTASKRGQARSV